MSRLCCHENLFVLLWKVVRRWKFTPLSQTPLPPEHSQVLGNTSDGFLDSEYLLANVIILT